MKKTESKLISKTIEIEAHCKISIQLPNRDVWGSFSYGEKRSIHTQDEKLIKKERISLQDTVDTEVQKSITSWIEENK